MSSSFGRWVRLHLFGESHGEAVGMVLDGLPAGEAVDIDALRAFLARRGGGRSPHSTARAEPDEPIFLSGLTNGATNGAPLCAVIHNRDVARGAYAAYRDTPRPGHADFTVRMRHGEYADLSGGGHASGRLTAALCLAGGVCLQALGRRGVSIGAHIAAIGGEADAPFDPVAISAPTLVEVARKAFPVLDDEAGGRMRARIDEARRDGDSVGGIVECAAVGLSAGIGAPLFDGVENRIASAMFAIGGVRGIEFGAGFSAAAMRGSDHNDAFCLTGGGVRTHTNRHGGILGGLTSGMPVLFRVAFKPTPSIEMPQRTVDLAAARETDIVVKGRHDPCIVPRAVPCVEAAAAVALLELLYQKNMA